MGRSTGPAETRRLVFLLRPVHLRWRALVVSGTARNGRHRARAGLVLHNLPPGATGHPYNRGDDMTDDTASADTTESKQRHGWPSGQSGNPAGRPKGARHVALLALDTIGAEGAAEVMKAVVEQAKAGDMRAAEILLQRLWPEGKGRPVAFTLPHMHAPADAVAALGAVADAVAAGEMSPKEGRAVASIIEAQRQAIETLELEARIATLEARGSQ